MTLNRYLPIWTYDVYEYYFNDYRWSPSSPKIKVKGYYRNESGRLDDSDSDDEGKVTVEVECEYDNVGGDEICTEEIIVSYLKIYWTTLKTLNLKQSVTLAATGAAILISL